MRPTTGHYGGEIAPYLAKSFSGAPRSMKMGTIASPCPYDAAARRGAPIAKSATSCDFALRLRGGCLSDFARWSGYPSIAALTIDPEINVMGQGAVISKVIRSSRLRAGAPLTVSEPDSFRRITRHYTARG
jgi:hypothetical protein